MSTNESTPPNYHAHDQQIFELTGLMPDVRSHIPIEEHRQTIGGVKSGDVAAMETLISQRLRWIYRYAHEKPEIQQRYDLELADVMQIGALATIEAARSRNVDMADPIFGTRFQLEVPRATDALLTRSKLVPTISLTSGRPAYYAHDYFSQRIVDTAESTEDEILEDLINEPRHRPEVNAELKSLLIYNELIHGLIEDLSERERQVIEMRFGIDRADPNAVPMTLREVGTVIGVSGERIRQIENETIQDLQNHPQVINDSTSGLDDDGINYGLGPADTLPEIQQYAEQKADLAAPDEKLAKQQAWLAEIKFKQQLGHTVFVKGNLLKRPLPEEVQDFLDNYNPNAVWAHPAHDLRRILK